jgi:hypothetical protein
MDYSALKDEIRQIAEIAGSVPEQFRDKCFEVLLNRLLNENAPQPGLPQATITPPAPTTSPTPATSSASATSTEPAKGAGAIPVKAQLRVFMQRTNVTIDELQRLLIVEDDDVHFVREPTHGKVARGQMEWALLLALKNAVLANEFSADPEDVRSMCQAKGFYDRANFAAIFKRQPGAGYFREPLEPQGPRQTLTNEGQNALGELVKNLTKSTE